MMKIMPVDQFKPEDFKTPPIQAGNDVEQRVDDIISQVRQRGDEALIAYARQFDRAEIDSVLVTEKEMEEAFAACDADQHGRGALRGPVLSSVPFDRPAGFPRPAFHLCPRVIAALQPETVLRRFNEPAGGSARIRDEAEEDMED